MFYDKSSGKEGIAMAEIIRTSDFEKKVLQAGKPVLVDFFATWCGPCKMMAPVVDELSETYDTFDVVKVDIDESMQLAEQYHIMSVPTFAVFKDGKLTGKTVGAQPKAELLKLLEIS